MTNCVSSAKLSNKKTFITSQCSCSPTPTNCNRTSAVADSGATSIYFAKDAPVTDIDPSSPTIVVGTATGQQQTSSATAKHRIPHLPEEFPRTGHIMPSFSQTLVGIGPICDAGFAVTFSKEDVVVHDKTGRDILTGWRKPTGARLWRFSLLPKHAPTRSPSAPHQRASLTAFSAYDLPSVEALVRWYHAAAGFPVRDTWLRAIKAGNFDSWPGLTYNNAARYCPSADETIKGHMTQTCQGVRSTKTKETTPTLLRAAGRAAVLR